MQIGQLVAMVRRVPPVTDNVPSADHLANGEETDDLGEGDTSQGNLLGIGVADPGQDGLGSAGKILQVGGVDERPEEGLEGGKTAAWGLAD